VSVKALSALVPPAMTTTQRNAIPAGNRPPGSTIFNTTTARVEMNFGSDAAPSWDAIADNAVTSAKIQDGTILTQDVAGPVADVGGLDGGKLAYDSVFGRKLRWNRGTAPPAAPFDGDLWVYPFTGGYWTFIYDSTEATYKWKFIGGVPLVSQDTGDRSGAFSANVWGQPYTPNPSITLPRAGDYLVTAGCSIRPNTAAATVWIGVQIGGTNPAVDGAWTAGGYMPVASARVPMNLTLLGTGFNASAILNLVYENTVAQNLVRNNAYLTVTPARVI
jgi:hypothetical protein